MPRISPVAGQPVGTGRVERPGDPEVRHQRAVLVQQDVLGLDVAVHHALPVGIGQRRAAWRAISSASAGQPLLAVEPCPERLALDVRHRVPEASGGFAGVEQRQDVGMLQARGEPDLPQEALRRRAAG